MDWKSNYCSRCSGKSKLTSCTCKSQLGDPAKLSGRSLPGRFTSSCSTKNDDGDLAEISRRALLALALRTNKNRAPPSFSEANRTEQPSSSKSACKPANEKSPPPTFCQLVDQKSGQPILSKSTYKPGSGGSHLPGSSNPAVKERLEKPGCSPCPVNEDRSVSGKRCVTEEIPPHGNAVKEGLNSKHNAEAFDELEMEDIARATLELFEGAKLLLRLSERKLSDINCLDMENRQERQGEEYRNSPTDKTSPSPSNAVRGKRRTGEEISPRVKKRVHWKDEKITMEQFEKGKIPSRFRAEIRDKFKKLQSACDDMASTLRRMGINVDDIAKTSYSSRSNQRTCFMGKSNLKRNSSNVDKTE